MVYNLRTKLSINVLTLFYRQAKTWMWEKGLLAPALWLLTTVSKDSLEAGVFSNNATKAEHTALIICANLRTEIKKRRQRICRRRWLGSQGQCGLSILQKTS